MLRRTFLSRTAGVRAVPQLARDWNFGEADFEKAKQTAATLGFPGDERIVFLSAKGIDCSKYLPIPPDSPNNTRKVDLIVNPPNKDWKKSAETLQRILGRFQDGAKKPNILASIPDKISFNKFVEEHPEWAPGKEVFVFFRDHPAVRDKNVLIQRVQLSSTCAIHAPVVMQHYLVAMANKGNAPTLDIPTWILKNAPLNVLDGVIFGDCVNSQSVLRYILLPESNMGTCYLDKVPAILQQYGPIMIHQWQVTKEFMKSKSWQYLRATPGKFIGGHSMLVVGARTTHQGETRVLVQNWWRTKQFFEVDEASIEACQATMWYVPTPQPKIPDAFIGSQTHAPYGVSALDRFGDGDTAEELDGV